MDDTSPQDRRRASGRGRLEQGDGTPAPESGLVLVAAASVGPIGGLTAPPAQFAALPGLAVAHLATGIYRLTFPGYAPSTPYLVTGIARVDLGEVPRIVERVTGNAGGIPPLLDESMGLHIRVSTLSGALVDSAFEVQVHAWVLAP